MYFINIDEIFNILYLQVYENENQSPVDFVVDTQLDVEQPFKKQCIPESEVPVSNMKLEFICY